MSEVEAVRNLFLVSTAQLFRAILLSARESLGPYIRFPRSFRSPLSPRFVRGAQ